MCGIAGLVGQGLAGRAALGRMLDAIRHRGPDGEGAWQGEGVALGHRRLAVIDLDGGRQPIGNEDGTAWLVCNGEIYNYRELRRDLLARGHRFRTESDSEVILHLYEDLGEDCVRHLRGMFAFAIWDGRRRRLLAARDRLGQKPFFWRETDAGFAFASEIKGLLALDGGKGEPSAEALHQYLALRLVAAPRTMFQGIAKLPPAHLLTFDEKAGVRTRRYWEPTFEPKLEGAEDDLLDELEAALIEAVRCHTVSDVPVGAFLSGGLDSTLVAAILARHGGTKEIPTFTLGLPYARFDEAPAARLVAERYGTAHHEATVRPSLMATLPSLVHHLDEPSDPLSVCGWLVAELASRHVKVVLGGDGGDELFAGYDRYWGNLRADWYARLPERLRRGVTGPLIGLLPAGGWYRSRGHQLRWLHRASFQAGGARYAATLGYFQLGPEWQASLYGPRLMAAAETFDAHEGIARAYAEAPAAQPLDRMLHADSRIRLPDHSALILDRTSMAHGLEVRSPFMDHRLVELAARLPVAMKLRGRTLRWAQRRLAARYLPAEILNRPKQGFASALPYLLKDELGRLQERLLTAPLLVRDGFLQQSGIDRLRAGQASGQADHGSRLWLLLNAEAWYRMRVLGWSRADLAAALGEAPAVGRAA
jgi:asparagine synthase (glutamine-hydrolysing)